MQIAFKTFPAKTNTAQNATGRAVVHVQ